MLHKENYWLLFTSESGAATGVEPTTVVVYVDSDSSFVEVVVEEAEAVCALEDWFFMEASSPATGPLETTLALLDAP